MQRIATACLTLTLLSVWTGVPGHASTLAKVLGRIAEMGGSPLATVMMNVAETAAAPVDQLRTLRPADRVVIGYGPGGVPVLAAADALGLRVTPEAAAALQTGLAAGLYPLGSALHRLPPAGQLSLVAQAQDGRRLDLARELVLSRIDGSVTTLVQGLLLPDLAPALMVAAHQDGPGDALLRLGAIASTVLGTVNAGELVTHVQAGWSADALTPRIDLALAGVDTGASTGWQAAATTAATADALRSAVMGGQPGARALVANLSSNAQAVTGAVRLRVDGVGIAASSAITTVLGAVNGGGIHGAHGP